MASNNFTNIQTPETSTSSIGAASGGVTAGGGAVYTINAATESSTKQDNNTHTAKKVRKNKGVCLLVTALAVAAAVAVAVVLYLEYGDSDDSDPKPVSVTSKPISVTSDPVTVTSQPVKAQYGTWRSPISSRLITENAVSLTDVRTDMDPGFSDFSVYWNEGRPEEGGRRVICSSDTSGNILEWTPSNMSARTTVHQYGGGSFIVHRGVVYFSNYGDQLLYRQTSPTAAPEPLTSHTPGSRFADGFFSTLKHRLYLVREEHGPGVSANNSSSAAWGHPPLANRTEAQNTIVSVHPETGVQSVLAAGKDFYSSPRVSPDGRKITWVEWSHPNMPWDSTELWTADLSEDGDSVLDGSAVKVAGGTDAEGNDVSVSLPSWTSGNDLLYVGDQTDWWNLYHVVLTSGGGQGQSQGQGQQHVNLHPVQEEIGGPQWTFGNRAYLVDPNNSHRMATTFGGKLGVLDTTGGSSSYQTIHTGFESHTQLAWAGDGHLYAIAASPTEFARLIRIRVAGRLASSDVTSDVSVVKVTRETPVDSGYISLPQRITWNTTDGDVSHGLLYLPANKDFGGGESGELPPVLMKAHGGPTGQFSVSLNLNIQYFTSRGFVVLCVDYRGSTGYGRRYRDKLKLMWGLSDIQDIRTGVEHVVEERKLADGNKTCISGGSAGGYSTLASLAFTSAFKAGVALYGISDLAVLAAETHKFESRYLDSLLAPMGSARAEQVLHDRSPINFLENITSPVAFFHGDQDQVVPPNQAEMMYQAVKGRGIPTMLVLFQGEQHGFRKADNIQASLDGELYFYGKVLGFQPADRIDDSQFHIDNL